ncbi:alpha-L-fucosidase [Streptomyces sp. NPDC051976]|uniref:alpha-L-fucosidase n=1 Tax=Streptomyces sp. NPDC051976 TaxID=3154947 RepID=UPI003424D01A
MSHDLSAGSEALPQDLERYGPQFTGAQAKGDDPLPPALPWRAGVESSAWWRAARFGMFVHFGVSSRLGFELSWSRDVPRPSDLQAIFQREGRPAQRVPHQVYDNLYREFDPTGFDAQRWVDVAAEAGAGYLVLTAKHHDGFCLWDTDETDYKVTSAECPLGRDIVAEVAQACHRSGMRFGIYYSQRDWHHPEYLRDGNAEYQRYMNAQLRELLTRYGTVDVLWFDSYGQSDLLADWNADETIRMARDLQPGILINNRLAIMAEYNAGPPQLWGDFDTPEGRIGAFQDGRPWESCLTLAGEQWGYLPDAEMLSLRECVHALVRCAVGDGNLLLNVGPDALGVIDDRQAARMAEIGVWLSAYGSTIRGTRGYQVPDVRWGGATRTPEAVYVHVLERFEPQVSIPAFDGWDGTAEVLTGGSTSVIERDSHLLVDISAIEPDAIDTIIRLGRTS